MVGTYQFLLRYGSVAALRAAVRANPGLREEVAAELAVVPILHPERCVMTHEYRAALVAALEE